MGEVINLKDYFETMIAEADKRYQQRFDAQSKAISDALQAAEKAVSKAEVATEKRFESVNEFRKTLSDQTITLMPRAEASTRFDAMSEKIDQLQRRIDKSEGAGGGLRQFWTYLIGAVGLLLTVVSLGAYFVGKH